MACVSGNKKIVELIMSYEWSQVYLAMSSACRSRNKELVQLLVSNGFKNYNEG